MRFRLHNQNAGQVKQNTTAIAALSSQVATQSATVTTQVTGEYPVPTSGTIIIDDTELTAVTFADAFSNGISHAYGASIFNVTAAGDYTINIQLRVTTGFDADRGNNANRGLYCAAYIQPADCRYRVLARDLGCNE